jgi:LacI family transcriptional regulator
LNVILRYSFIARYLHVYAHIMLYFVTLFSENSYMDNTPHATRVYRVGLAIFPTTQYGQDIIQGISQYARTHATGRWLFYADPWQRETSLIEALDMCDGLIAPFHYYPKAVTHAVLRRGLPAVNIASNRLSPQLGHVTLDNLAIGEMAARHLLDCGFRRFAFCGLRTSLFSDDRRKGFYRVLAKAGVSERPRYALHMSERSSWKLSQSHLCRWIASLPKPIGIFACNDQRGREVLEACRTIRVRVPEEAAVLGVDNTAYICEFTDPPLSSVELNGVQVGFEAAAMMDRLLENPQVPAESVLIQPRRIVPRQSTDIVAIRDAEIATAVRFIRGHARNGILVSDVLREIPIARRSLEQRFRNLLGRTPAQEIRRVQLERVRTLLLETEMSIPRIARESGFANATRLGEALRREYGMTPIQCRKQFRLGK